MINKTGLAMKFAILFLACFCAIQANLDCNQIERIDQQIEQLREMKRGYESHAIRAQDQADRLQFEDHFVLETRRYYRIADQNREKAEKVQEMIDRLEAEKEELLNQKIKK